VQIACCVVLGFAAVIVVVYQTFAENYRVDCPYGTLLGMVAIACMISFVLIWRFGNPSTPVEDYLQRLLQFLHLRRKRI